MVTFVMPWITVQYFPGFAGDLTSWQTVIEEDGSLKQEVKVCRFAPLEERTEQWSARLSPDQVAEIRRLVAEVDFEGLAAAMGQIAFDDAEQCSVKVQDGEKVFRIDAPLFFWSLLQKNSQMPPFDLTPVLRLWHALDAASPFGMHSSGG